MRQELIIAFSADLIALKKRLPYSKGEKKRIIMKEIEEIESTISFLLSFKRKESYED